MKKEWADKWVAALRSGKYKQGRQRLRSKDDHFCCLGVACDLVAPEAWKLGRTEYCHFRGESNTLPHPVRREMGLFSEYGSPRDFDGPTLVSMNDRGKTFDEIADFIEGNWERL